MTLTFAICLRTSTVKRLAPFQIMNLDPIMHSIFRSRRAPLGQSRSSFSLDLTFLAVRQGSG
jgi:hypothetical protein